MQAIPLIAEQAADLTVLQRTPNYVMPARNGLVPDDVRAARQQDFAGIKERIRKSYFGF